MVEIRSIVAAVADAQDARDEYGQVPCVPWEWTRIPGQSSDRWAA